MAGCQEALDYLSFRRAHRQREVLLFLTEEETADAAFSIADNRICRGQLLEHPMVARINEQATSLGVCKL